LLVLKKIKFKNFFSYGNYYTEIILDNYKTNIISASNGSGKSVLLDAIVFSLYGKPYRKINKSDIINSINKKDCVVELYFENNNKFYKIIRGIKPNIFQIYKNDNLIPSPNNINDYQKILETILGINYKTFINVVILGSAKYASFMDLSLADRRELVEELLDIKIFSFMNGLVKEKLKDIKKELLDLEHEKTLIKEKIKSNQKVIDSQKKNNEELIDKRNSDISLYKENIKELEIKKQFLDSQITELLDKISNKQEVYEKQQKGIKIKAKVESEEKRIIKENSFYENYDECPTCKQSLNLEFKNNILIKNKEELIIYNEKKNKVDNGLKILKNKILEIEKIIEEINNIRNNVSRIDSDIKNYNFNIEKFYKEIKELNNKTDLEEYYKEIKVFENKLDRLVLENNNLENDKNHYDFILEMLKDDGIKSLIIKQYIPILNKRINHYLNEMNFFVSFYFNESFEEVIKSRYMDEYKINSFSEGEKLRINLAILFAFRDIAKIKNSVNCNLLIMDEVADGSGDGQCVEDLFKLISLFENQNIFIISHKNEMLDEHFDRKIKISKNKNFSRIEEIL